MRQVKCFLVILGLIVSLSAGAGQTSVSKMQGVKPTYYGQEIVTTIINKSPFYINLDRFVKTGSVSVYPALDLVSYDAKTFITQILTSKNAGVDFYYYDVLSPYSLCHFFINVFSDGTLMASAGSYGNLDCTAKVVNYDQVEFTIWPVMG